MTVKIFAVVARLQMLFNCPLSACYAGIAVAVLLLATLLANRHTPTHISLTRFLEYSPFQPGAAWCSDGIVGRISEVALHRARLVLGWLTVFGR